MSPKPKEFDPNQFDPEQWKRITQTDESFRTYVVQVLSILEDSIDEIKEDIQAIKTRLDMED